MSLWVVKVGTSLLRGNEQNSTAEVIENYSACLCESINRGDRVVLVTSGAVGLGCRRLGLKQRPVDVVSLQAAAAIGQGQLMALYEAAMGRRGIAVAQVLLTRSDFGSRHRYRNASSTLRQLIDWGVLPVVNENDTLSPEELRYGDNDTLSALVATAIDADQLIMLTDVDQLYSSDPRFNATAEPISDIYHPREITALEDAAGEGGRWGTGGMSTKLAAARIATASGITVHLADGRKPQVLDGLLKGVRSGTVFHPHPQPLGNRKSWLAHALKPLGTLQLDQGACDALEHRGASLLLVGIRAVEGSFEANQAVRLVNHEGNELARGLSSFSSKELIDAIETPISSNRSPVVVHRDVLVLCNE
ncbi:MAG: glutamate 5-kinase [Prochlorococcus sp.]|nr:glutamate 5-kinase [Prochlorococcaceae cyanobacterium ETNP14_MAG_4]HJM81083.1 glutamate 5-kinase [Prochlorococcaceae cyanobacterium Fu_MAG_72]|tara:strand:- start:2315 stop:3400 length:1086 start_codon:yes stop_codon:yes gene_type:complete